MSRFDEFRDSLEEAAKSLEEAVDFLNAYDFDSEEDRYSDVHCALSAACSALQSAVEDVSDNVGIRCDLGELKEICVLIEQLADQALVNISECLYDEERDDERARKYARSIRALQRDLAEIIRVSW